MFDETRRGYADRMDSLPEKYQLTPSPSRRSAYGSMPFFFRGTYRPLIISFVLSSLLYLVIFSAKTCRPVSPPVKLNDVTVIYKSDNADVSSDQLEIVHVKSLGAELDESEPVHVRARESEPDHEPLHKISSEVPHRPTARDRPAGKCWSKQERHLYYQESPSSNPSLALSERLKSYEAMHRRCTSGIGNWTEHFLGIGEPRLSDCQYLIPNCGSGVGNVLLTYVSMFLYSLLTNRAILLNWSNIRQHLCSPFPDSDWMMAWDMQALAKEQEHKAPRLPDLLKLKRKGTLESAPPRHAWLNLGWDLEESDETFFCTEGQDVVSKVQWVMYHSDQYGVPAYFGMPQFEAELDRLFPERIVFSQLAPYLLHPNNLLWERITRFHSAYHSRSDYKVGIQVRTFSSKDEYAHERIMKCGVEVAQALPATIPSNQWGDAMMSHDRKQPWEPPASPLVQQVVGVKVPQLVSVFVTSLHAHHAEYFKTEFTEKVAVDGSALIVSSGSHETNEEHGWEQDMQAMVEIWLLSFSDVLLASDVSTFGYVAAGLSGKRPYLMNNKVDNYNDMSSYYNNGRPVCMPVNTTEPCFQFPPKVTKCLKKRPFIQPCYDWAMGQSLMPKV